MPTCLGGLKPCDVSGLCLSASCPSGWTWNSATCRCDWPDNPTGPTDTCQCPTCMRVSLLTRDCSPTSCGGHTVSNYCPDGWGPYTTSAFSGGNFTFHKPDCTCYPGFGQNQSWCFSGGDFCCPPNPTARKWPTDCGACESGTWDPLLGYCTHAPCPAGKCWCNLSGLCIDCPDPACKAQLNCYWDEDACNWHCDSPTCPAGQFYSLADCACKVAGGAANLHDRWGRYHIAQGTAGGIRYRRSDFDRPPFRIDVNATATAGDTRPCIAQDWRGRLLLLIERGGNTLEAVSADHSLTWTGAPRTVFTGGSHPCVKVDPENGLILRAAYKAHTIIATREYPGDLSEGAQFTFKDSGGTPLAIEDDDFDLSVVGGGPLKRYQLVARKTGMTDVTCWYSTDFAATWTEETA